MTGVVLEVGGRRTFAMALDWPGWGRSGREAGSALEALGAYLPRYMPLARRATGEAPSADFDVVATVEGNATTDFGAPGMPVDTDGPLAGNRLERFLAILDVVWAELDDVARSAPEELTKGPRGGGRDTSKIVEHVTGAEQAYAAKIGIRGKGLTPAQLRTAITERLSTLGEEETKWPASYFVRRVAWHVTDHLWEIQDRS